MSDSITGGGKILGDSFADELKAADLLGLPFSWSKDGVMEFGDSMTQQQIESVMAVYVAHRSDESAT
jgi:hypothetical protein